ncbi:MAG TPA: rod shape-determining protein MreC [Acidobacteriaceae bacterium]|jgi:rod shape-determining protein MreC|nr:rod shape-determining protein MreC [Acidobacteriaceae bacterium]
MESFYSRYRNALVLITVLMVQVVGLAVQVRRPGPNPSDKGSVRLIRSWVVGLVSPPERLLRSSGHGFRSMWMNYVDLIHVRQHNRDLKSQLDHLRLEEESLAEDARQGQRLQALLGFQEKYIYKTVAAQVIGTSGTEQSKVLLIDKGSRDGLKPDMPVITPDGIVGKTRDVFGHTAQVLEISDPTSGAGVILEKTRIRGVLRGDSWGHPEIVNISPDERIQKGDTVVTSGGDAIYPRGLAVGSVQKVVPDPDGTLVNVMIKPAADLARLEEVLIITSTGSVMPAQMQDDLSQAAEAEQKASDVLAERLPSRVDPNAASGQPQDTSSLRAPPPPQALHPDRFSPSDSEPATDMVPGQRLAPAEASASVSPPSPQTAPPPDERPAAAAPLKPKPSAARPLARSVPLRTQQANPPTAKNPSTDQPRTHEPARPPAGEGTPPSTPPNPQGGA